MDNVTVLFPGGFKPITGAHMQLADRYANNPQVKRVIMLIGPKERMGTTRNDSAQIFNLINQNPKIELQPTNFNSPLTAAYEYLFDLPEDAAGQYALAASNKDSDYVRVKDFIPNVENYKIVGDKKGRKIPSGVDAIELMVDIDPLTTDNGEFISATTANASLDDYEVFRQQYPQYEDAIVKNIFQILNKTIESAFSKDWWEKELSEDLDAVIEGYMDTETSKKHSAKIKKLRKFLDSNTGKEFVYDFDDLEKTILGVRLTESVLLKEGGLAGHMAHPYETHGLTFNDMKEIVARSLDGRLDIEKAVTEKTDGQNIFVTWKDGQIKFARNKGERVNPLTVTELQEKFGGRGAVSDAFGEAGNDLYGAFSKISEEHLNRIFKNGRIFANMEIIYPQTRNVVAYEGAYLQFHNLTEFDEKGNPVMTDMPGGAQLQRVIQDANAHLQNTYQIIPPRQIKLGRVDNFEDYQDALFNEIDQLKSKYGLNETDRVSEYHRRWWRDVIQQKANQLNYNIPEELISILVDRWAFGDKEINKTKLKKQIDNEEFLNWFIATDQAPVLKKIQKENIEPFESIFLKLGAIVLKNMKDFLATNPDKSVQQIRKDVSDSIRALRSTNDPKQLDMLKTQLRRIQNLGGFESIVPVEGIVFTYKGETYKLTGSFAPINQLTGILKYSR